MKSKHVFIHGRKHLLTESVLEIVCSMSRRNANILSPSFGLIRVQRPVSDSGLGGNECCPNHSREEHR